MWICVIEKPRVGIFAIMEYVPFTNVESLPVEVEM